MEGIEGIKMSEQATVIVYVQGKEFAFNLRDYVVEPELHEVKKGFFKRGFLWYELRIRKIGTSGRPEDGAGWSLPEDEFMSFGLPLTWRILRGNVEANYYSSHKKESK